MPASTPNHEHEHGVAITKPVVDAAALAWRRMRHTVRRTRRLAVGRLRWLAGRADGLAYRLSGRHPDYDAPDRVIAERVRADLGVELKKRGLHGVHAESVEHVIYLRGAVEIGDAQHLEQLALEVPGVVGVASYLDVTASPRPGEPIRLPSDALTRMTAAARAEGCRPPGDRTAVLAVLATFAGRIPPSELRHVWAHVPLDLRGLLQPPVRLGAAPRRLRHPADFYAAVSAASGLDAEMAERLTERLFRELRTMVPEEVADIEAVLPAQLKQVWELAAH